MVVRRRANIDGPAPGGPRRSTLWSERLHPLYVELVLSRTYDTRSRLKRGPGTHGPPRPAGGVLRRSSRVTSGRRDGMALSAPFESGPPVAADARPPIPVPPQRLDSGGRPAAVSRLGPVHGAAIWHGPRPRAIGVSDIFAGPGDGLPRDVRIAGARAAHDRSGIRGARDDINDFSCVIRCTLLQIGPPHREVHGVPINHAGCCHHSRGCR
jgi:hypothetical protein